MKPVITMLLLIAALLPSLANAQDLSQAIPSPWAGSLTKAEQQATLSDEAYQTQPMEGASWNQGPCVIAYRHENTAAEIAEARANFDRQVRAQLDAAVRNEWSSENRRQLEQNHREYRERLEAKIAKEQKIADEHLAQRDKCRGVFFRPALEDICHRFDDGSRNRFCDQLGGAILPGVTLTEDKANFTHQIALHALADLSLNDAVFVTNRWQAMAENHNYKKPTTTMTIDDEGMYIFETPNGPRMGLFMNDTLFRLREARDSSLAAIASSGVKSIYASNNLYAANGAKGGNEPGLWGFSIDLSHGLKSEFGTDALQAFANISQETGLVSDLGDYIQFPRIHFQAFLFDILVQSDAAVFAVETADGQLHPLSASAHFQQAPEGSTILFTDYPGYKVHATMIPDAPDLAKVLAPDAKYLTASFEMMLQDGSIDVVTLRTDLAGIREAWQGMNANNRENARLLREDAAVWQGRIVKLERDIAQNEERRRVAIAAALAESEKEARKFIADKPFSRPCPALPTTITAQWAKTQNVTRDCDRAWVIDAVRTRTQLARMMNVYRELGGKDRFIEIQHGLWDRAIDQRNAEVARFNVEVDRYNEMMARRPARVATRTVTMREDTSRRQRSYARRQSRPRSSGRDHAQEFYDSLSRPPRRMFRDVTIPPSANSYMGSSYW